MDASTKMTNGTRYGAVIFDDEVAHGAGWACVAGDDPIRICGTHELQSDVVWVTNLDYNTSRISGLQGSRFRRSNYLLHDLTRLCNEIGIAGEKDSMIDPKSVFDGRYSTAISLKAGFSAWILDRIIQISVNMLPMNVAPLSDIQSGIREFIIPTEAAYFYNGEIPEGTALEALEASDIPWNHASRTGIKIEGRKVRLNTNRARHAQYMMTVRFPVGDWSDIGGAKLLNKRPKEAVIGWLADHPGALLRVTMKTTDYDMEGLINFGGNNSNNPRSGNWLVAPELARLLPFCEFTIHEAIEGHEMRSVGQLIHNAGIDFKEVVERRSASYPFQVWMEILWRSVMGRPRSWSKKTINPAGAFMRAADRGMEFFAAHTLLEAGLTVIGYGAGAVTAIIPDGMPAMEWVSAILRAGLTPPFVEAGTLDPQWIVDLLEVQIAAGDLSEQEAVLWAAFLMGDLDMLIQISESSFLWTGKNGN